MHFFVSFLRFLVGICRFALSVLAGITGNLLMIISGFVLLAATYMTTADLTLQNVAILAFSALAFILGFYLYSKNI